MPRNGFLFSIFVRSDLSLDGCPVDLDILGVLEEFLIALLGLALGLQEPLSVSDYRVHMSSVLDSDLQSSVPLVQLDVKLDRSVEQSRGQKD